LKKGFPLVVVAAIESLGPLLIGGRDGHVPTPDEED